MISSHVLMCSGLRKGFCPTLWTSPKRSTPLGGSQQCLQNCSTAGPPQTPSGVAQRGRGELGTAAAISPASGSRPTTAEPPAPSLVPAEQGPEAVLNSLDPLCATSAQDRHKLVVTTCPPPLALPVKPSKRSAAHAHLVRSAVLKSAPCING